MTWYVYRATNGSVRAMPRSLSAGEMRPGEVLVHIANNTTRPGAIGQYKKQGGNIPAPSMPGADRRTTPSQPPPPGSRPSPSPDDEVPYAEVEYGDGDLYAIPVDAQGRSEIPELEGRENLTPAENWALSGMPIVLGSSNVNEIWYKWQTHDLYVQFLDDSVYVYHDVPFRVATGMYETASPGRYVWNVLRPGGYSYERLHKGNKKRKPNVIRVQ